MANLDDSEVVIRHQGDRDAEIADNDGDRFEEALSYPDRDDAHINDTYDSSYCVTRKELLAVVTTVKQFHHYLYGRKLLVRSDHGALQWIMNFTKPKGQVARWIEMLSAYDFQ